MTPSLRAATFGVPENPTISNQPSIAVVIVNWNSREDVLAGLGSLQAQTDSALEVVVVDNGSTDGSAEAIRAQFPQVRLVETGANLGFAEGCNRGIDASRSDWVFLFNNDAAAEPDCVEHLRRAAAVAPEDVGMVQPLMLFAAHPSHVNSSGLVVYRTGYAGDRHFGEPREAALGAGDPFCSTAGAALYRRSMLEELRLESGVLDRTFFMYFEDVDLGWRGRLAGRRAIFVPEARVRHRYQGSSRRRGRAFVTTQLRVNRVAMLLRNASVTFLLRTALNSVLDLGLVLVTQGPRPLLGLARRLPAVWRERREIGRRARCERRSVERVWFKNAPARPPDRILPDRAPGS